MALHNTRLRFQLATRNNAFKVVKVHCNSCGKKTMSPYYDTTTGDIADLGQYGICDRSDACGYSQRPPKKAGPSLLTQEQADKITPKVIDPTYIPFAEYMPYTLSSALNSNPFIIFLATHFNNASVLRVVMDYKLGSWLTDRMTHEVIYPQIDCNFNMRTAKCMQYEDKSVEKGYPSINRSKYMSRGKLRASMGWLHSHYFEYSLVQCLFGLHLTVGNDLPIHVVESEKTALIASVKNNKVIWVATGGSQCLVPEKFDSLKDRTVVFHPDHGAEVLWEEKLKRYFPKEDFPNYTISKATLQHGEPGDDLADIILKQLKDA